MGLVLLIIGLWAELRLHRYLELSPDFSGTAIYVILGLSCLIIIVNAFALNSIRKSHMVMLYVVSVKIQFLNLDINSKQKPKMLG